MIVCHQESIWRKEREEVAGERAKSKIDGRKEGSEAKRERRTQMNRRRIGDPQELYSELYITRLTRASEDANKINHLK